MFKQFNDFFTIYALIIEDCMNDENKYDILVDYINGSFSCIIRNKETKAITYSKRIITSSLEANLAIDTIRNNFIFNHFISLPGINNNTDFSNVKVHNLMNTKFNLLITLRNDNDLKRAYVAQKYALDKMEIQRKKTKQIA